MNVRKVQYPIDELPPVVWVYVHSPHNVHLSRRVMLMRANRRWYPDWEDIVSAAEEFHCEPSDLEIYY